MSILDVTQYLLDRLLNTWSSAGFSVVPMRKDFLLFLKNVLIFVRYCMCLLSSFLSEGAGWQRLYREGWVWVHREVHRQGGERFEWGLKVHRLTIHPKYDGHGYLIRRTCLKMMWWSWIMVKQFLCGLERMPVKWKRSCPWRVLR